MERDKEIQQAAENYASQMCIDCSARIYCEERNKKCVEYREQVKVYADAVKWADEHPKNVWHKVSEEPAGNNWKILCQDEMNGCWVENRVDAMLLHNNWNEYAACECIIRWAYISDLLPKQFGISEQLKGGEE